MLPNCKIMKRFKIFFIVLCSVLAAKAQSIVFNNQVPKHEVRAVWLTTIGGIDWPHSYAQSSFSAEKQKRELTNILDRLQQAKINTVLIQTRVRGTMIYPSAPIFLMSFGIFCLRVLQPSAFHFPTGMVTTQACSSIPRLWHSSMANFRAS